MSMSNYLEQQLRTHIFRTGSFTKPSALYVALHTADPTDAASANEVSTSSTGYARVQRDPLDANWTAASSTDGKTDNAAAITFGTPTGNWGQVTHFSIWDASTSGNMLISGALDAPKNVNVGDPAPSFAIGALAVTFD